MMLLRIGNALLNIDKIISADFIDWAITPCGEEAPIRPLLTITFDNKTTRSFTGTEAMVVWRQLNYSAINLHEVENASTNQS